VNVWLHFSQVVLNAFLIESQQASFSVILSQTSGRATYKLINFIVPPYVSTIRVAIYADPRNLD
jgi:hypothetical protein